MSKYKIIKIEINEPFVEYVDNYLKNHKDLEYADTSLIEEYKVDSYTNTPIKCTMRRIIFRKRDKYDND